MLDCQLLHNFHCQFVLVSGNICGRKYRSHFVLCRSNFVVLGCCENAQFPKLFVQISHVIPNSRLQVCKILVIQFLSLWRHCTEQGSASHNQVFPLVIHCLINQEVFLFWANSRSNLGSGGIAKQPQNPNGLFAQNIHRTQQRCFLIQCFACIRNECSWDVQRTFLYKTERSRIPSRITSCRTGGTQTAGRERRSIRFALYEFLTGEVHNYHAVVCWCNKGVVLFSSRTGHWLEPMGIVCCTVFNCPILQCICNDISISRIQRHTQLSGLGQCLINCLWQSCFHYFIIKDITRKVFRNIFRHDR